MRLPLLVNGTPRKITQCAIVRIPKGDWRIVIENWLDSVLELSPVPSVEHDVRFQTNEPMSIQLCVTKPGKETNLSVYLERVAEDARTG